MRSKTAEDLRKEFKKERKKAARAVINLYATQVFQDILGTKNATTPPCPRCGERNMKWDGLRRYCATCGETYYGGH